MVSSLIEKVFEDKEGFSEFICSLTQEEHEESIFRKIQNFLLKFIKFDAFLGAVVNWDMEWITFEYIVNISKNIIYERESIPLNEKDTLSGWVVKNRKSLYIEDTKKKKELPANLRLVGEPMRSWIGVPMFFKDQVIGIISIQALKPGTFSMEDLSLVRFIADTTAPIFNVKIVENELRLVKQKDEMIENALSSIGIIQDKKLVYVNKQTEEFTGLKKNEIIGKNFLEFVHPDDRELLLKYHIKRVQGAYAPKEYIARFINKNGETRWGMVRAKKIMWNGKVAILFTIIDVSTLKRYADYLRDMEKYFTKLGSVKDENEVYEVFMDSIQQIFDISEVLIGVVKNDILKVIKRRGYSDIPAEIVDDSGEFEMVISKKTPRYREYNGKVEYIVPVEVEEGIWNIVAVRGNHIPHRELIRVMADYLSRNIKRIHLYRKLEESRNIQRLMIHMVTHDLQNILSVISGYAELLKERYIGEYVEEIEKALKKSEEIIARARLFSRLDIDRIDEKIEEIDVRELIERAYDDVKASHKNSVIKIHGNAKIKGRCLLRNAFYNILHNAYKYGATEVNVKIENLVGRVMIKFADNASGIPKNMRDEIFKKYVRIDTESSGMGLGLWITKKIVELHHGKIWVEENKPKGSVFVIEIPTS